MLPDEPPLGSDALLLGDLLADEQQQAQQQRLQGKMETLVEETTSLLCSTAAALANTETTETVDCTSVFKAGSISVRKDMVARLPAMHVSDFKRNLRALEQPCLKVNELKLNSSNSKNLKLCDSALRVLNTPNVRPISAIFSSSALGSLSPRIWILSISLS